MATKGAGTPGEFEEDEDELYDEMVKTPNSTMTLNTPSKGSMCVEEDAEDEQLYGRNANVLTPTQRALRGDDDAECMYVQQHKASTATATSRTTASRENSLSDES